MIWSFIERSLNQHNPSFIEEEDSVKKNYLLWNVNRRWCITFERWRMSTRACRRRAFMQPLLSEFTSSFQWKTTAMTSRTKGHVLHQMTTTTTDTMKSEEKKKRIWLWTSVSGNSGEQERWWSLPSLFLSLSVSLSSPSLLMVEQRKNRRKGKEKMKPYQLPRYI